MTEWYWTKCADGWYYCDRDCTDCVNSDLSDDCLDEEDDEDDVLD